MVCNSYISGFSDFRIFMIQCILVLNEQGKSRLVRFYDKATTQQEQKIIVQQVFDLVSNNQSECCFIEDKKLQGKLIFRHFASLYFIVVADACESELGILDMLQVFVHVLDKTFGNICELDIVYHYDRVNHVLDEMVMAGMVLETNLDVLIKTVCS